MCSSHSWAKALTLKLTHSWKNPQILSVNFWGYFKSVFQREENRARLFVVTFSKIKNFATRIFKQSEMFLCCKIRAAGPCICYLTLDNLWLSFLSHTDQQWTLNWHFLSMNVHEATYVKCQSLKFNRQNF